MARLESTAKGGYYPIPVPFLTAIAKLFHASKFGGRGLDPVAGEGEAAELLFNALALDAYTNELEKDRAAKCRERFGLDRAIQGDIFELSTPHSAFTVVYDNPPYTFEGTVPKERRELGMVQAAWRWLQTRGYMVTVVYDRHLTQDMAYQFALNCDQVDVFRWHEAHLDTNYYIAIIGRKAKETRKREDAQLEAQRLFMMNVNKTIPNIIDQTEPRYTLPRPEALRDFYFQHQTPKPEHLLQLIQDRGAQYTSRYATMIRRRVTPPVNKLPVRPKTAHLLMHITTGALDRAMLDTPNGKALLRSTIKHTIEELSVETHDDDSTTTIQHVRPVPRITLLFKDGTIQNMSSDAELKEFLITYQDQLFAHAAERLTPIYDISANEETYAPKKKYLPILRKLRVKGKHPLYAVQQQVVAASLTSLEQMRGILMIAQQGTGKTSMASAMMVCMQLTGQMRTGESFMVTCPGHLVKKWAREIKSMIPKSYVTTLMLENERGRQDILANLMKHIRTAKKLPDDMVKVIIISQDTAKLGEGWEPAVMRSKRDEALIRCPVTGVEPMREGDNGELETLRLDNLKEKQHFTLGTQISRRFDPETRQWVIGEISINHRSHALWQERRVVGLPKGSNGRAKKVGDKVYSMLPREPVRDSWIAMKGIRTGRNPRGPLWRLLERQKDAIGVLFVDEIHESQNTASDRGQSMAHLARAARKIVGLTGTIFNGYASSLYGIETIFNVSLFEWYEWGAAGRAAWVSDMGVLRRVIETKGDTYKNGVWSGVKRDTMKQDEAPGASPLLVRVTSPHSIYLSLRDLGAQLPDYQEIPMPVDMGEEQREYHDDGMGIIKDYLLMCKDDGDNSFLSNYFRASIDWPDTGFRPMNVVHHKKLRDAEGKVLEIRDIDVHSFSKLDATYQLPKETALRELVKEELAQGRGVGIYVQQTGKERTYAPRLVKLLQDIPGAKPVVLTDKIEPIDREEWLIEQVESGANILITNPFLVQTGLDMYDFQTLVFYEPEYRLAVLMQASARAWRLGQDKPCKVIYMYYRNTMQEQAMALISRKKLAAAVVTGDEVNLSALSGANGGGDILKELMSGTSLEVPDLQTEFAKINAKTKAMMQGHDSEWASGDNWYAEADTVEAKLQKLQRSDWAIDVEAPVKQLSLF